MKLAVALAVLAVLFPAAAARADSGTESVTFNEIVLPANFTAPPNFLGFTVTSGQCLDAMAGTDAGLTFYSTITVTLPSLVADSDAFGWTPVDWSVGNFGADYSLFLDQWNNLPGVVISDASVTESTIPPSVPEPGELGMLAAGLFLLAALKWRKKILPAAALLALPFAAHAQNYPQMVPSTAQINFANPDGSALFLGQVGTAQVTFTIENGPITFKQNSAYPIELAGSPGPYTAEADDVKMDQGCRGVWQTGDTCTITFSVEADGDDQRCDPNSVNPPPAYPNGCDGFIQIKVPNAPSPTLIAYSYQFASAVPRLSVSPVTLAFGDVNMGETSATLTSEIKNTGDVPLQLAIGAPSNAAFAIVANECPNPLPSQQICDVTVSFTPAKTGAASAKIPLTDNASPPSDYPDVIRLSGTGVQP
jgi:hypothetical protein